MKKLLLLAIVVLGITLSSYAQSVSEAATATTTLITPISILKEGNLNFGTIASSNTLGTVVIAPDGTVNSDGGVTLISGTTTAASFTVTGEGTTDVYVDYPPSIVLKGTTTPTNTLTVSLIKAASEGGTAIAIGGHLPLIGGQLVIKLGGTLTIPALTVADTYENTEDLKVTVNYQ